MRAPERPQFIGDGVVIGAELVVDHGESVKSRPPVAEFFASYRVAGEPARRIPSEKENGEQARWLHRVITTSRGTLLKQRRGDVANDGFPITDHRLAEQPHGWIPRAVGAIAQP